MTQKRGKGRGPADWQKLVSASDPEDMAPAPKKAKSGGQRNKVEPAEETPASPPNETAQEPHLLAPARRPIPAAKPKLAQFNVRLPEHLPRRIEAEVEEYREAGYVRTRQDIVAEALTLYYDMKDGNTQ